MASIENNSTEYAHSSEYNNLFSMPVSSGLDSRPSTPISPSRSISTSRSRSDSIWSNHGGGSISPLSVSSSSLSTSPLVRSEAVLSSKSRHPRPVKIQLRDSGSTILLPIPSSRKRSRSVASNEGISSISAYHDHATAYNQSTIQNWPKFVISPKVDSRERFNRFIKPLKEPQLPVFSFDELWDRARRVEAHLARCNLPLLTSRLRSDSTSSCGSDYSESTVLSPEDEEKASYHKSILQLCAENPKSPTEIVPTRQKDIFCCSQMENLTYGDSDDDLLAPYFVVDTSVEWVPIKPGEEWFESELRKITDVIELIPTNHLSTIGEKDFQGAKRYFAWLSLNNKSFVEITFDTFQIWNDDASVEQECRSYYNCGEHMESYQLVIYVKKKKRVLEGLGLKKMELSAKQIAREKRRMRAQQLTYGRKDEIDELIGKDNMSKRLEEYDFYFGRLSL